MKLHYAGKHKDIPMQCKNCSMRFYDGDELLEHIKFRHRLTGVRDFLSLSVKAVEEMKYEFRDYFVLGFTSSIEPYLP